MAFQVSLDFEGLPDALEPGSPAAIIREESKRAVDEGLIVLKNGLVKASPFGGTNTLRTGWQIQPAVPQPKRTAGSVTNATVQASVIEKGAKRHRPPSGPTGEPALGVWIRRKLGISEPKEVRKAAFLIGRAIKKRGLPSVQGLPKRFFSKIVRILEPRVDAIMETMSQRITERLSEE